MAGAKEIYSILKATEALKCLAAGKNQSSVIADTLQLSRSTTHRILKTLHSAGLAIQDPVSRKYYPGPLLYTLVAEPLNSHQILTQCALEDMEALRDTIEESVAIHIAHGARRIVIDAVHAPGPIRFLSGRGESAPLYIGASGKILLSQFSDEALSAFLEGVKILQTTPKIVADQNSLTMEIKRAKKRGYAVAYGEYFEGAASIAVPISNYICPVTINAAGPEKRIRRKSTLILEKLKVSAESITRKLETIPSISLSRVKTVFGKS